jgi:hypothetical protein
MAIADREAPRDGTRSAVRYWAARTRESLRFTEAILDEPDMEAAEEWARDAEGCAAEFMLSVLNYAAEKRIT